MERTHLPRHSWFIAVHIITSHPNGISALQLQAQLGLGSYKSAWLLLQKLRRAMVDPDRNLVLSHFRSGLSAHLCDLSFESQGAFSAQR